MSLSPLHSKGLMGHDDDHEDHDDHDDDNDKDGYDDKDADNGKQLPLRSPSPAHSKGLMTNIFLGYKGSWRGLNVGV